MVLGKHYVTLVLIGYKFLVLVHIAHDVVGIQDVWTYAHIPWAFLDSTVGVWIGLEHLLLSL